MLCHSEMSQLVVIDMQSRLLNVMSEGDRVNVINNSRTLVKAASLLEVPLVITEQYPKGLGHTDEALTGVLTAVDTVEKTCFSCVGSDAFRHLTTRPDRSQYVICGIEAHVCVLQTAMDLIADGKQVFVVEDAVCSRNIDNKHNALQRIQHAGGIVTNMESVLFEWLKDAGHPGFKQISSLIR